MQEISKKSLLTTFLIREKWLLLLTIILGLLSSIFMLLIPIGIGKYYELIFGITSKKTVVFDVLPDFWFNSVPNFIITFLCIVVLRHLFYFFQRFYTSYLGELFVKELREKLFAHQLRISLDVYESKGTGKYLLRYSGDLNSIRRYLTTGIIRFIIDIILIITAVLVLFLLNKVLVLVVMAGLLIAAVAVFILNKFLHRASLNLRDRKSGMLGFVNRSLLSVETIKSFDQYAISEKRFNKRSNVIFQQSMKYHFLNSLISSIIPTILFVCLTSVLYVAYLLVNKQGGFYSFSETVETDQLLAYLLIMITMLPVFRRFLKVSTRWKLGNISFHKLVRVLNTDVNQVRPERVTGKNMTKGKVSFVNYTLVGQQETNLPSSLNFSIELGKSTALVFDQKYWGVDLIRELLGLKEVEIGDIQLNNKSISRVNPERNLGRVSILSMRLPLHGKTVYESISPAKSPRKKEKATAMLNRLLKNSKDRVLLNDFLSEQSANLADSQRFTMVSARAFLTKFDVLIVEGFQDMETYDNFDEVKQVLMEFKSKKKTIIFLETGSLNDSLSGLIDETVDLNREATS